MEKLYSVFLVTQHMFLKSASKSFFRFTEKPGVPGRNIWAVPMMKLHLVPEGPAVQINLLLLLEFIPPVLLQSEACYNLSQPCKSLGIGLPEDKRTLSFSKLWLDQHFAKSDDRQRGQAQVCAWGAQVPGIKPTRGCLREMPSTWMFVPGEETLVPGMIHSTLKISNCCI